MSQHNNDGTHVHIYIDPHPNTYLHIHLNTQAQSANIINSPANSIVIKDTAFSNSPVLSPFKANDPRLYGPSNIFKASQQNIFKDSFLNLAVLGPFKDEVKFSELLKIAPDLNLKDINKIQFQNYWPGNIRELRNILKWAVLNAKSDTVNPIDLPDFGHDRVNFKATREAFEKNYIVELLKTFNWEVEKTCQVSRIDKSTLISKIQRYGIQAPPGMELHLQ
jgi:hypothetical protein